LNRQRETSCRRAESQNKSLLCDCAHIAAGDQTIYTDMTSPSAAVIELPEAEEHSGDSPVKVFSEDCVCNLALSPQPWVTDICCVSGMQMIAGCDEGQVFVEIFTCESEGPREDLCDFFP